MTALVRMPRDHRPNADERALLEAALLDGGAALDAWERFRLSQHSIETLEGDEYRLLPQIYLNLRASDCRDGFLGRMKGVYRRTSYVNHLHFKEAAEAIALFQESGIRTMLLDHPALSGRHVGDVGARPFGSVGLLVPRNEVERALGLLCRQGWAVDGRCRRRDLLGGWRCVQLHKDDRARLTLRCSGMHPGLCDDDDMWSAAVMVSLWGVEVLVPGAADRLIRTCLSDPGWTQAPLRWIPDVTLGLRVSPLDEARLAARSREYRVGLEVADALEVLSEFGVEFADDLPARLRRAADAWERVLNRVKMDPHRRDPFWSAVRHAARACEMAQRVSSVASSSSGHRVRAPRVLLDMSVVRMGQWKLWRSGWGRVERLGV